MTCLLVRSDDSPGDTKVMHGQLLVGQIYRRAALRAETQWRWTLNGCRMVRIGSRASASPPRRKRGLQR
jgi:hypothetical protein